MDCGAFIVDQLPISCIAEPARSPSKAALTSRVICGQIKGARIVLDKAIDSHGLLRRPLEAVSRKSQLGQGCRDADRSEKPRDFRDGGVPPCLEARLDDRTPSASAISAISAAVAERL